jgi:hypothetical protein
VVPGDYKYSLSRDRSHSDGFRKVLKCIQNHYSHCLQGLKNL